MKILVAMSGGVDSSVAAALLHEQGHTVVGIHMKLHEKASTGEANPKSCCGTQDALDARMVAERMGFDYDVVDLQQSFQKAVLANFVAEYKAGRTPIPCTHCNGTLKFDMLFQYADSLGCDAVATGHYAIIKDGGMWAAKHQEKDQSYFLWNIKPERIPRILFPLGDMTKDEVRAHAVRLGLVTAAKPESMDLCFIPSGDVKGFLAQHITEDLSGDIVDNQTGSVVGRHQGIHGYTLGQRKGLRVPTLGYTAYVSKLDPSTKTVYLAPIEDVLKATFQVKDCSWFTEELPEKVFVRVRHRHPLSECSIDGDTVTLHVKAVCTPGQAAVFYDKDGRVLGGGWIH